ncbi:hypothetical protein C8J57DRAFT_1258662 [Mycena rebaudengoi]|nr:hypothetical protein C8J57DRAFT_1258662 [Mycena rebaudengoi]
MSLLRLPQALLGHRLGYPVETLSISLAMDTIVFLVFFLLTALLAIANNSFTPQVLTVGDSFRLNNSEIVFTITEAFNRNNHLLPVSCFSYFNNPFSDGCYVSQLSITPSCKLDVGSARDYYSVVDNVTPLDGPRGQAQATVTCITSAMGNVERSLARIRHTLRKHGIEEDEAEDHCNNSPRGIFPLLEIENIHLTLSSTDGKDMNPLRTQS